MERPLGVQIQLDVPGTDLREIASQAEAPEAMSMC